MLTLVAVARPLTHTSTAFTTKHTISHLITFTMHIHKHTFGAATPQHTTAVEAASKQ